MIRIINNTTFGYWNGRNVEPRTKNDPPFSVSPEREAELVTLGIAEYVTESDEKSEQESPGEETEQPEITLEYLKSLKMDELREVAAQFGVDYKVGTKKADFAESVWAAIDIEPDEEPTDEEPPAFDPSDAIV